MEVDYAVIFGLVIGGLGILKVAEWIIISALPKKSVLTLEEYEMLRNLHALHDQKDANGVPVWYVRGSLEKAIIALCENIDKLGITLETMRQNCNVNTKTIEKISDRLIKASDD